MRLLLLLCTVTFTYASTITMTLHSTGSLIARLMKENRYESYLKMVDEQRKNATRHSKFYTWQALTSWNDEVYLGKISVGTPGQVLFLSMDTGSSTMWVVDGACNSPICNGYPDSGRPKNKFYYGNSTTFARTNSDFAFNYGTRWAAGFIGTDTVAFGKLTVWYGQQFGVSTTLAPFFGTVPIDGVFGLGWSESDNMRAPISMLMHYLDSKQFTVWMNRSATHGTMQVGGYITYGGYNDVHCDRTTFYVPLAMDKKWAVDIEGFEIGSFTYAGEGDKALSDTGTSWIGVPNDLLNNILWQTRGWWDNSRRLYIVECSTMHTLPPMVFRIAGLKFTVPPDQYILDLNIGNGQCVLAVFPVEAGAFKTQFILGQPFIRTYCQTYDMKNKRIGISVARHQRI
ncbi:hypothetical protein Y032_0195g1488 [Ancylostoma ceylanicum]|uniref:Peptidase A1 domain-containing protein n=2 Tax=Ancylostoma ceylanicum TaxID=53326 RepID=A0A016SNX5_9BILA|nr:hypothetical protein Y032_0195g1488 [Ancylostoma ceylanicum]